MAKRIYLESRQAVIPGWVPGGAVFGHMYLVYRDEGSLPNDASDKVIMGHGTTGNLLVNANVNIGLTDDAYNGATAAARRSLDITDFIINAGVMGSAQAAWEAMSALVQGIGNAQYDYETPDGFTNHTSNSGATILSALNAVGVDIRTLPRHDGVPGTYLSSYFTGAFPGASSSAEPTLLGTGTDPEIVASERQQSGLILLGRDNVNDVMIGTKFEDRYYGEQEVAYSATVDRVSYARVVSDLGLSDGLNVSFGLGSLGVYPITRPVEVFGVNAGVGGALAPTLSDKLFGIEVVELSTRADTVSPSYSRRGSFWAGGCGIRV